MFRHWVACSLLLLFLGCKDRQAPAAPPSAVEETQAQTPTEELDEAAEATPEPEPVEVREAAEPTAAAEPTEQTPSQPLQPARDLGEELRRAVGSPTDCIQDYRPVSATTIQVRVSAVVRPTGMIIEPSASGAGLSMNDRRCIEERVGAVLLEPLPGQGSENVYTTITLRYEPPVVEEYDVAPPPAPPDDVVQALPKKKPIAPSGQPIEGPAADPIEGPDGVPIDGPDAVPIEGPKGIPIGSE